MRTLALIDLKIDKDEALALLDDYGDFIEKHTGIKCTFYVERRDFSFVPTMPDSDGDLKPTTKYLTELANEVHSRYGDYGVDNIVLWVHEDNFTFRGIWGTNLSYIYHKYSVQLCRWDKDNSANTFGTLYHEQMHSFDSVILKETGININPLFENAWDTNVVHGKGEKWDYIGRRTGRENTKALELIAPYLRQAYQKRLEAHFEPFRAVQKTIIAQLQSLIKSLLRR